MSDQIWLNNPTILLDNKKINEIFPMSNMNFEEKVNAITRLIILVTIIVYMITLRTNIILIGLVAIISVLLIYTLQNNKNKEEFTNNLLNTDAIMSNSNLYEIDKTNFDTPKKNNPFMNVLVPDLYYNTDKKEAAPTYNEEVEKKINDSVKEFVSEKFGSDDIKDKLFGSLGEELTLDRSMLQFSATANTTIPNNQEDFQNYLYGDMISGKEGNPIALERHSAGAYNWTNY